MDKPALFEGINKLEKRLQSYDKVFTVGDAAAIIGYDLDSAKKILDALMQKYDCRLKVTDKGDLIYDFGNYLHLRGERTWEEWWFGVQQWLWKAFVFIFKIWIALTLVVYFIIFLVILIALIIASTASNNSDSSSSSSSSSSDFGFFRLLGEIFESIFIWNTSSTRTIHYETDSRGYTYRSYDPNYSTLGKLKNKKSKGFVASVYDFVFGPERVEFTQQDHEKEVAAYLRQNKGLIVKPEILALGGWTADKGDDFFTNLLTRYKGDSKITENAVLYGEFFELARSTSSGADAKIVWYWDEYEPEYKLTGNSFWRNVGVAFMNLFNLTFATFFLLGLTYETTEMSEGTTNSLFIGLGVVPFIFSVLFFTVPILRSIRLMPLRRKRAKENIRKRIMKAIYLSSQTQMSLNELLQAVNTQTKGKEERLSEDTVRRIAQELVNDFGGNLDIQNNSQIVFDFTQLREELEEVKKLRRTFGSESGLGNVVFDTNE